MKITTPLRHLWEGVDTNGREVRAYLIVKQTAGISPYVKLPALVFRVRAEWKREAGYLEMLRESTAAINAYAAQRASAAGKTSVKLKRQPRAAGAVWNVAAVVPLDEFARVRQFATPLGLERVFRPTMARLTVAQLNTLAVALDAWLDSDGSRSLAKELRA